MLRAVHGRTPTSSPASKVMTLVEALGGAVISWTTYCPVGDELVRAGSLRAQKPVG